MSVRIESSDGHLFTVTREVASCSKTLKNLLEDVRSEESPLIPIPCVKGKILSLMVTYCKQRGENGGGSGAPQDLEVTVILELLSAANYLDIPWLIEWCTASFADRLIGLPIESVYAELGMKDGAAREMTAAERAEIEADSVWNECF